MMKMIVNALTILVAGLLASCSNAIDGFFIRMVSHPQEPKQRHYTVREIAIINPSDGTRLAGELTYPSTGKNFIAFVLISGHAAGQPPADRNSVITGHKYFLVILEKYFYVYSFG